MLKQYQDHIIAVAIFIGLALAYFSPILNGKTLAQHDVVQAHAMAKEIIDHKEKTGEVTRWTGRMFSGMPADQIWSTYPNNWAGAVLKAIKTVFPRPVNVLLLYLIGMYVLLIAVGCNSWLAILGSVGFAFSTYNFTIIEAGHLSKVKAIAFIAPIFAGIWFSFRKKYLLGLALIALFVALQLRSNHLQITYYMGLLIVLWGIYELIEALRDKGILNFSKSVAVITIGFVLGVLPNLSIIWPTYEYSKETIRGKQELTEKKIDGDGLDKGYALSWSYSKTETMTLLVPYFMGGKSYESLDKESASYEALTDLGVPRRQAENFVQQIPTYWGPQPTQSGPAYYGALMLFLMVLALFIVKSRFKWWLLSGALFCLFLSWGKHLQWFYDIFWNTLPMFNKFRSPTMIIAVGNVCVIWLSALGIKELMDRELKWNEFKKPFLYSLGIVGGICLILALMGGALFDFTGPSDVRFSQQYANMAKNQAFADALMAGIMEDRASMLKSDSWRSLGFIVVGAGLIFFWVRGKIKANYALMGLAFLALIDLWGVDKRYLNNDDFVKKTTRKATYNTTPADQAILMDTDPHFRVLNLAVNTFNDAIPSYHYKTIGGYHAAKLKRYQDLIERHISPEMRKLNQGFENTPVLNMLNTKYVVTGESPEQIFSNTSNLGECWFVSEVKWVDNADEEIDALNGFNPAKTAVIDKQFESHVTGVDFNQQLLGYIKFETYAPNKVTYTSNSNNTQLAVFSEIYYKAGRDWKAYIDGEEAEFIRANYVLRAMVIPAGEHSIEFRFEPVAYVMGERIALAGSLLIALLLLAYPMRKRIPGLKNID